MDTEVTLDATKSTEHHRRASRPYRLIEAVGIVVLLYGLAFGEWRIGLAAAGLIAVTYTLYRRRHGQVPAGDPGPMGMGGGD